MNERVYSIITVPVEEKDKLMKYVDVLNTVLPLLNGKYQVTEGEFQGRKYVELWTDEINYPFIDSNFIPYSIVSNPTSYVYKKIMYRNLKEYSFVTRRQECEKLVERLNFIVGGNMFGPFILCYEVNQDNNTLDIGIAINTKYRLEDMISYLESSTRYISK